jgi:NAD(P)H-hydrate repair Nnr-like enzyme with NAD(P)H-hydrate dehydratase domain
LVVLLITWTLLLLLLLLMQTGADMSFVFCSPAAATPIKSYSPDLIVVPALVDTRNAKVGHGLR